MSTSSNLSQRRPVARRACLGCREKKIKCDGEIVEADGRSTGVCSNCRFLHIECVFIPSMRGGRRRKRGVIDDGALMDGLTPGSLEGSDRSLAETWRSQGPPDRHPTSRNSDARESNGVRRAEHPIDASRELPGEYSHRPRPPLLHWPKPPYHGPPHSLHHPPQPLRSHPHEFPHGPPPPPPHHHWPPSDRQRHPPFPYGPPYEHHGPVFERPGPSLDHHGSPYDRHGQLYDRRGPLYSHHGPPFDRRGSRYEYSVVPPGPPFPSAPHGYGAPFYRESHSLNLSKEQEEESATGQRLSGYPRRVNEEHPRSPRARPVLPPLNRNPLKREGGGSCPATPSLKKSRFLRDPLLSYSSSETKRSPSASDVSSRQFSSDYQAHPPSAVSLNFDAVHLPPHGSVLSPSKGSSLPSDTSLPLATTSRRVNTGLVLFGVSDAHLEAYNLPPWRYATVLFDLYYRYIHLARPVMPPKRRLLTSLALQTDASLIHAMFANLCRYAPVGLLPDPMRLASHWYHLAEKHWEQMGQESAMKALVMLAGSLGPGGYFILSMEGTQRALMLVELCRLLSTYRAFDPTELAAFELAASIRQICDREEGVRNLWGMWKLSVLLRMNLGYPYRALPKGLSLSFPSAMELPRLDEVHHRGLDPGVEAPLTWSEATALLERSDVSDRSPGKPRLYDSVTAILSVRLMEEAMDSIVHRELDVKTLTRLSERLKTLRTVTKRYLSIANPSPVRLLNSSFVFSLLLQSITLIALSAIPAQHLLMFKLFQSEDSSLPKLFMMTPVLELPLASLPRNLQRASPAEWLLVTTLAKAVLDVDHVISLGEGAALGGGTGEPLRVLCGPTSYEPAKEVATLEYKNRSWWELALETQSRTPLAVAGEPDGWLQFPLFSGVPCAAALATVLSLMVISHYVRFVEQEGGVLVVSQSPTSTGSLSVGGHIPLQSLLIPLSPDESRRLCAAFAPPLLREIFDRLVRYLYVWGRIWPYMKASLVQVDRLKAAVTEVMELVQKSPSEPQEL